MTDTAFQTQLQCLYSARTQIRAGILLVGDVPSEIQLVARDTIADSGLNYRRRLATLQPRVHEGCVRAPDVLEFMHLYGGEYAVTVFAHWPECAGYETRLIDGAHACGSRTIWILSPTADESALVAQADLTVTWTADRGLVVVS